MTSVGLESSLWFEKVQSSELQWACVGALLCGDRGVVTEALPLQRSEPEENSLSAQMPSLSSAQGGRLVCRVS